MPTAMEVDTPGRLDAARELQTKLEDARLHILEDKDHFDAMQSLLAKDLDLVAEGVGGLTDPAIVPVEVASQMTYLRNLKFQYLEQKAKDLYVKTIVSDEAPNINAEDNELLRVENEQKKARLSAAKAQLAEKYGDVRTLAPLVEQDYHKAKTLTQEAATLASKILDARLKLTRLRSAYPHPRLTVPAANAQLDDQILQMQKLDEELQRVNEEVERVKEEVKQGAREVERLRVERSALEKTVKATKDEVEDERVVGLYDWFTRALALHRSLFSLVSSHAESENELDLIYNITPRDSTIPRRISIKLLFLPNSRQLADAQIEGLVEDIGDVVGAHTQANDVPGLIAAILARARAGL